MVVKPEEVKEKPFRQLVETGKYLHENDLVRRITRTGVSNMRSVDMFIFAETQVFRAYLVIILNLK